MRSAGTFSARRLATPLGSLTKSESLIASVTMHRPANVDDPETFAGLMSAIERLQREIPMVFPVHPRARKAIEALHQPMANLIFTEPLGYFDFMKLVRDARFVLTDSGGVQEETTYLGVPCLTMRANTERPITVTSGTNQLVGLDPAAIVAAGLRTLENPSAAGRIPELWDGRAAERIVSALSGTAENNHRCTQMHTDEEKLAKVVER